ncbi:glycosyltransferase [Sphingobium sp. YR768]|uniref:glycosyltransferase n=1 Tax=Sphingobium sp. YR768 TaxID=1884365 RepID=UPI0008AFD589|nr:glycosyltransferase [Sphingobium sp. YR768]SER56847.1 Glycosyltransferase like family 2 [Sphingobium sp. YR768]
MAEPAHRLASLDCGTSPVSLCVCVPARNEGERIATLLDAIAVQSWPGIICVSIAVNNTTDDSLERIGEARTRHAGRLDIRAVVAEFPAALAHAGSARRLAMTEGLRSLSSLEAGILVSTDADVRPPVDWLSNIATAFGRGADLVGGRIVIDEENEPLPPSVTQLQRAWDEYWSKVREIEDRIDPVIWDPAPRHGDHTGASLAIRAALYLACGGVPLLATGEDRALVQAAVAMGGRLAHPADVYVRVSPRTDGRAEGGMAAGMRALFKAAESKNPPMAPAFDHWIERATWRKSMRQRADGGANIAHHEACLPPMPHDMQLEAGR